MSTVTQSQLGRDRSKDRRSMGDSQSQMAKKNYSRLQQKTKMKEIIISTFIKKHVKQLTNGDPGDKALIEYQMKIQQLLSQQFDSFFNGTDADSSSIRNMRELEEHLLKALNNYNNNSALSKVPLYGGLPMISSR